MTVHSHSVTQTESLGMFYHYEIVLKKDITIKSAFAQPVYKYFADSHFMLLGKSTDCILLL